MPTYEYECLECEKRFEVFQRITEKPLSACRFCGGKAKRLIGGGAAVIFKGSGFYITDYRSEGYRKKAKEEKKDSGGPPKDRDADTGGKKKKGTGPGSSEGGKKR